MAKSSKEDAQLLGLWLQMAIEKGLVHRNEELVDRTLQRLFPQGKLRAAEIVARVKGKKGGSLALQQLLHDTAG